MKTVFKLAAMACLVSLGACSRSPTENNAANVQDAMENLADNMEAVADNVSNAQVAGNLNNGAEAVRDAGSNAAATIRDSGTTANNVEANTVGM
jgi:DNA-binding IscR family transcriptional regulator